MAIRAALAAALSVAAAACAGSTIGSGVGDAMFERPPFQAGRNATGGLTIGHVAITYQRGASDEPMFDPPDGSSTATASLVAEMNGYLDSLRLSSRIRVATAEPGRRPDVEFGCATDFSGECDFGGGPAGDRRHRMRLAITRPSGEWTAWFGGELRRAGAAGALLITLEVGQYWPRQRNLLGSKSIELGTDYAVSLPWLTALDRPIRVLQLTGALLDESGRAIRIGAEGLVARRTNLLQGSFGLQALITDEDVEALLESRREDLPGRPLVWEVALRNLVAGLTRGSASYESADEAIAAEAGHEPAVRADEAGRPAWTVAPVRPVRQNGDARTARWSPTPARHRARRAGYRRRARSA